MEGIFALLGNGMQHDGQILITAVIGMMVSVASASGSALALR
jgi:hypothetical protein